MPLDAAIGRLFAPYRPSGRHGHQFWRKKSSCGIVKSLFKASVQKARNGPSTQLIKATSCVERSNATIKPKSTANFLAIGQQSLKLPIPKEACQKIGGRDRQYLLSCFILPKNKVF
jgi:hypothetical protein